MAYQVASFVSRGYTAVGPSAGDEASPNKIPSLAMTEQRHRRQYLIGASAGYTCLVISLLVYSLEGGLAARGWIPERTINAFVWLYMAVLCLFPASLSYSRMLFARSKSAESTEPQADPLKARRLVTWTVLLTIALALVIEVSVVGTEAFWHNAAAAKP
jgi:hypothetical protein